MSFQLRLKSVERRQHEYNGGAYFHSLGPIAQKALPPTVESLYLGTTIRLPLLDLRVCAGMYACTNSRY